MTRQLPCISLRINRWRSLFFGFLTFLFVIVGSIACTPNPPIPTNRVNADADCRVIQHARGKTCVPNHPQRIVVLGGLDEALTLGIKPVGSDGLRTHGVHLTDKLAGIEDVGGNDAPNIEKILALKPDFIIGGDYISLDYNLLSRIAPTVLIPFEHSGKWKEFFTRYAEALGKTTEAEQVMNHYKARIAEFQKQIGNRAADFKVSIMRVYPTHINTYLKDSFCGTVIADAGLSRPPSQDLTASQAKSLFGNQIQYTVSLEKLQDADGDAIFIWSYGHQSAIVEKAQAEKEKLTSNLLWSKLTAVQKGRVYDVPEYWIGNGPIAANAVLDDLFKYLIDNPKS